jgi:16S rRNA A1518/A1519 N6-dimethyltransferase RsmA/KsgA/DIM1 with predicted DNA glycosylase/AP lyase activity
LDYWNHNSVYHPMIVTIAKELNGDVLDVGCGEGLLVERLAKVSRSATGVDRDEHALSQARVRTSALANAAVMHSDFMEIEVVPDSRRGPSAICRDATTGRSAPGGWTVGQQIGD